MHSFSSPRPSNLGLLGKLEITSFCLHLGGVGSGRIMFRRDGRGDVVILDIFGVQRLTLVGIVFGLGEESLVLLPSSNSSS